jgi:hypothetical protein
VEVCNSEVMTVYLWHMLPVVVAGVLLYPSRLMSQPAAGSAQWWILRPVWIVVLALLLAPLLLAGRRLRRPRPRPRPQPQSAASPGPAAGGYPPLLYAAIALTSLALARFAIAGFAPDGRLPVSATAVYAAGVLLMAADGLLVRRRRLALESAAAR